MSAVAATRTATVPRGASAVERASIRLAVAMTRWATRRAERRHERREALLLVIHDAQTRRADPRATAHLLSQLGAPGR